MYGKRQYDPAPATYYRTDRISTVNGQYFFATREGTLEGPFFTRFDAQQGASRYSRLHSSKVPPSPRRH
ncbi:hypothetical protein D3C78_1103470 [compost metagenome]